MTSDGDGRSPSPYPVITSTANERIKATAGLLRRRGREQQQRFLAEGHEVIAEALRDGLVDDLYVTEDGLARLTRRADLTGVPTTLVSDNVLAKLADSVTPQGAVAVVRREAATLEAVVGSGLLVVLDGVADPGNAGTILRSADHAGAAGVVFTNGSVDPWNPKAVRAAAGSVTHLPVVVGVAVDEVVATCRANDVRLVALHPGGRVAVGTPGIFAPPVALVLGGEAQGLSDAVLDSVDEVVVVPRFGRAESLNLAAATAVALYAAAHEVHGSRSDRADAT